MWCPPIVRLVSGISVFSSFPVPTFSKKVEKRSLDTANSQQVVPAHPPLPGVQAGRCTNSNKCWFRAPRVTCLVCVSFAGEVKTKTRRSATSPSGSPRTWSASRHLITVNQRLAVWLWLKKSTLAMKASPRGLWSGVGLLLILVPTTGKKNNH